MNRLPSNNSVGKYMKNSEFWNEKWGTSAQENTDARFMSGWGDRSIQEMLSSINDIAKKLRLTNTDVLLDVGCGAGLFELAFTYWIKEIYGIDYSDEMVSIAKLNTLNYNNIIIDKGNICDLPYQNNFFDKILVHGVLQYLNDMEEVKIALAELKRVSKMNSIISLSLHPDKEKKNDYINGYYTIGLSDEEIKVKIEINNKIIWFDKIELVKNIENVGFSVIEVGKPVIPFQSKYYFDMILCNGNPQKRG